MKFRGESGFFGANFRGGEFGGENFRGDLAEILGEHFGEFWANLEQFSEILKKFNQTHSLTNYENIQKIALDSILVMKFCEFRGKNIADIGSGAGFPAIFLAIANREAKFCLFEPNNKKYSFLVYVKSVLNLENVEIYPKKIETATPFVADIITSRAVMKTGDLLKICKNFYNSKTQFILYKGSEANAEIKGINGNIEIIDGVERRKYILIRGIL